MREVQRFDEAPVAERAKNVGQVLRKARKSRGLTQADIAPTLGVSRSTVAQMENGKRVVKAEDIDRIGRGLTVSL